MRDEKMNNAVMTQDALNKAYNNTLAVDNFAGIMAAFTQESQACYKNSHVVRDIAYSREKRNRFDFFASDNKNAATLIFIHGGYWQNCCKEDFAFIAGGPLSRHYNVILVEYTLAPVATMTQIVSEISLLLDFLNENQKAYNLTPGQICLSGHSAGGQLTALHRNHPLISHAMTLSALTELEPIKLSWLNKNLKLTEEEVSEFSPMKHISKGTPVAVHVGELELPELIRHSQQYAEAMQICGDRVFYRPIPGRNHFSLLEEFEKHGQEPVIKIVYLPVFDMFTPTTETGKLWTKRNLGRSLPNWLKASKPKLTSMHFPAC